MVKAGEVVEEAVPVQEPVLTRAAKPAPAPPEDPTTLLTRLWTELLGHCDLAAHSDFFDLGGDSLLATRLARRATRELGVRVPVRDLMTARSLSGQAELLTALMTAR
ncbi:putative polyketide synthase [Streptomyces purpurascens]